MTTELEQEFFNVFGIELKIYETDGRDIDDNGDVCSWYIEEVYPEITDRKLLEMICIAMKYKNTYQFVNGIEDLKEQTLKILISIKDMLSIYTEIQQLFKEEE